MFEVPARAIVTYRNTANGAWMLPGPKSCPNTLIVRHVSSPGETDGGYRARPVRAEMRMSWMDSGEAQITKAHSRYRVRKEALMSPSNESRSGSPHGSWLPVAVSLALRAVAVIGISFRVFHARGNVTCGRSANDAAAHANSWH